MYPRPKILIVDDEPFNIDYLEQELEDLHYNTVSAANGQAALAQVAAESPDLILLDIMMPVMDGFTALVHLKAEQKWRNIPIVIISAMNDMASVVKGIELGAEDYLPKPFDPILLRARVSACLEKKRLRDQEQLYLKALERELEIGRQIQAGFLPNSLPQLPGWEIAAYFQAAREVAGDFYDVFPVGQEKKMGLMVGDVCGKGVGAALFMTLFRSLIRATANHDDFTGQKSPASPDQMFDSATVLHNTISLTNNYVARIHHQATIFATLFIGLLDPLTGTLIYVNGGHEPALIIGPTGIKARLEPTGPVVGLFFNTVYHIKETYLEPGDMLYAFTDGVTDAQDTAREMFGRPTLLSLLAQPVSSAQALLDQIETSLNAHVDGASQYDDITMLAVRRAGAIGEPVANPQK